MTLRAFLWPFVFRRTPTHSPHRFRRPSPLMASSLHPLPHTRIPAVLFPTAAAAAKYVAREIDKLVRARNAAGKPTVLGLATGSPPRSACTANSSACTRRRGSTSPGSSRSTWTSTTRCRRRTRTRTSGGCTRRSSTTSTSSGRTSTSRTARSTADEVDAFCAEYERKIKAAGGIDIQILGIGRTGHIGFNEPGSPRNSRTRHGHARQHHPARRGRRVLRRGERPAPGDHDGRRPASSTPAGSS